eukprot:XP_013969898.1 DNA-directed RNA polymerase III subunit RPC5 [Canis lupus familiaris]
MWPPCGFLWLVVAAAVAWIVSRLETTLPGALSLVTLFLVHLRTLPNPLVCWARTDTALEGRGGKESPGTEPPREVEFPPQTAASPDEQKVFALWESGDMSDQHRQVLLEIFSKNYRVRRNMIQSRLTQECGEDLSKQEVDKVLKDCCVSYGGMWYLKGTVQS